MKEILYEFVEIDDDASFNQIGKAFNGTAHSNKLNFDNPTVKGEISKYHPEDGLWIRKWRLTVYDKITLRKVIAPPHHPKKFSLIYFLNPSIFVLRDGRKKLRLGNHRNTVFASNDVLIDFSVLPKQPFFVLDITFTFEWFLKQFNDDCSPHDGKLSSYISKESNSIIKEACNANDYKLLNELDDVISDRDNMLFVRSRIYLLICSFFNKLISEEVDLKSVSHHMQVLQAEKILTENFSRVPKIHEIARKVNISVSSLIRQFKGMYGKSMYKYYLEKKMDESKKLILQGLNVNKVAVAMGYKQTSAFIAAFSKQFKCTPGDLKLQSVRKK